MYFFYLDESGNTGTNLDSVNQPIHWLVALAVSPRAVRGIEDAMAGIARRYFRDQAAQPEFELHGSHIFQGRERCRSLTPTQRVTLYDDLMALVGQHDCSVFVRGIHKARHRDRARDQGYTPDHPHKLGFMYLVERLDEWLEAQQEEGDSDPVYGLVVADEQREVDREIVESFAFWRDHGTDHGYRTRDILYLIDTVHYVPSHDSWLIQLADCIAYLRNRCSRVYRDSGWEEDDWSRSEKAIVRLWREHCEPHVVSDRVWPLSE